MFEKHIAGKYDKAGRWSLTKDEVAFLKAPLQEGSVVKIRRYELDRMEMNRCVSTFQGLQQGKIEERALGHAIVLSSEGATRRCNRRIIKGAEELERRLDSLEVVWYRLDSNFTVYRVLGPKAKFGDTMFK